MLFDLKGKRRRAVQGTYLMLAVLMGAGLVLFGIGSSTNGGLGDLFSGGGGSNKGNSVVQNLQVLRWNMTRGIMTAWNVLIDILGEKDEWYEEIAQRVANGDGPGASH